MAIHPSVVARYPQVCRHLIIYYTIAHHGAWIRLPQTPWRQKEIHVRSSSIEGGAFKPN